MHDSGVNWSKVWEEYVSLLMINGTEARSKVTAAHKHTGSAGA